MSTEETTNPDDVEMIALQVGIRQYHPDDEPEALTRTLGVDPLIVFEPESREVNGPVVTLAGRLYLSDVPVEVAATLLRAIAEVLDEGLASGKLAGDGDDGGVTLNA